MPSLLAPFPLYATQRLARLLAAAVPLPRRDPPNISFTAPPLPPAASASSVRSRFSRLAASESERAALRPRRRAARFFTQSRPSFRCLCARNTALARVPPRRRLEDAATVRTPNSRPLSRLPPSARASSPPPRAPRLPSACPPSDSLLPLAPADSCAAPSRRRVPQLRPSVPRCVRHAGVLNLSGRGALPPVVCRARNLPALPRFPGRARTSRGRSCRLQTCAEDAFKARARARGCSRSESGSPGARTHASQLLCQ